MIRTIIDIILIGFLAISGFLYLVLIIEYTLNLRILLKRGGVTPTDKSITISVIIAARNEENNIKNILNDLVKQNYPLDKFEIIIVDDSSDDDTYNIVYNFINDNGSHAFQLIKTEEKKNFGKKNALTQGIALAKGDLIVQTDADCSVGTEWLSIIVDNYNQSKPKMMFGLVAYKNDKTIFEKLQHLEFLSLIASGAAAAYTKPIMCNGANLIYERKAYQEVKGLGVDKIFASGDDVFLLLRFKKHFGNENIKVITDIKAIVYTQAKETLKDFINQRIRWASKSKGYKDWDIIKVSLIVFAFNLGLLLTLMLSIIFNSLFSLFLIFFILKIIIDIPILYIICKHIQRRDLLKYYILLQIVYLPYLCFTAIAGFTSKYSWKGRRIAS
ncbi:MAG: glycosyltransferase [Bacteroidota bacterium]